MGHGREIEVFTVGQVCCRPTQKEAEDYYHYSIIEMADWGSVDGMLRIKNITRRRSAPKSTRRSASISLRAAIGGYRCRHAGSHRRAVRRSERAGMRGIAFSLVNYLDELPYFRDEVLPRLEKMGVREKN